MRTPDFSKLAQKVPRPTWETVKLWGLVILVIVAVIVTRIDAIDITAREYRFMQERCVEGIVSWKWGSDFMGREKVEWFCFRK